MINLPHYEWLGLRGTVISNWHIGSVIRWGITTTPTGCENNQKA